MKNEELQNQEFKYCLVGNIVQEREYGENHEIVKGTKAFRPGTKVYVSPSFCGDGGENRYVIGLSRHKKYIKIITEIKHIENFRFQKVYKPAILKLMADNSKGYDSWYESTDEEKKYIEDEAKLLNSKDNPYLKNEPYDFGTYIVENSLNTSFINSENNTKYTYVTVDYIAYPTNKKYCYSPGNLNIEIGDIVVVNRRWDGDVLAKVIAINNYARNEAPCPPENLKEIKKVVDADYILDDYALFPKPPTNEELLELFNNPKYTYISVYYEDGLTSKTYSYAPGKFSVKVGDRVWVDRNGEMATAVVIGINQYTRFEAPCPPEILKEIEDTVDPNYIEKTIEEKEIENMSPKERDFFEKWDIKPFDVLKHRTFNRDEIAKSNKCGCYYCERIYNALEIVDWLERDAKQTAICPYCGQPFVLGSASGLPIYDFEFIEDMNNYFF